MLFHDYMSYGTASSYTDFINTLSWFRMYCIGRFGKNKTDYLNGLKSLEDNYEELWWDEDEKKNFSFLGPSVVDVVLDEVRKKLNVKRLDDKQIGEAGSLLFNFLEKDEKHFRSHYFKYKDRTTSSDDYPQELYIAVKELLDNDHNDEAVLTAFKYLDSHLQKLLGLSPHEHHGEDLINKAFSSNSGTLQLGTDPNEQIGLRNFFSGANAIFRNPSAHRFMRFENFDTATIVAMIAVMARLASQIAKKNQKKSTE